MIGSIACKQYSQIHVE